MPGTTPFLHLPYAVPSDPLADGATTYADAVKMIESAIILPDNSINGDDPPLGVAGSPYPTRGIFTVGVTTATGWPATNGQVLSISRGGQIAQFWLGNPLGANSGLQYRQGSSAGWGPWFVILGTATPVFAAGELNSVPVTPNAVRSVSITYPAGRFTQTPRPFLEARTNTPQLYELSVANLSQTGFDAQIWATTSNNLSGLYWLAVQGAL